MKAGRELDALIAEKVMGWKVDSDKLHVSKPDKDREGVYWSVPLTEGDWGAFSPSTQIADAWLVVEKFNCFVLQTDGFGDVPIHCELARTGQLGEASADTAPLAICLAALKAKGELT